ncbi:DUF6895 family protein [Actinoalloteichus spitiensis]|uniref:DUF6895 family protein n=1 Tax=Actinoalloteichus spitiensis TaxID=252394 RepID=UPI00035C1344|nr:hypothetical protein [Actinoalloteichus spitiensis]
MRDALLSIGHHVGTSALEWLDGAAHLFAFPPDVPVLDVNTNRHVKPLAEFALAGSIAVREGATGSRQAQISPVLMDYAWNALGNGSFLHELQLAMPVETYPMEIYAMFTRAGYRHPELEVLLAHLGRLRAAHARELLPNRQLALTNSARLIGLEPHADEAELVARTWLGNASEPWALDFATAYAMTHTVFHLSDWAGQPERLPRRMVDYLRRWLPVWLDVYREAQQWDLVGELLMVDLCLPDPEFPADTWIAYATAQNEDGLMPFGSEAPPEDTEDAFRNYYHPTVVAAVAGTLLVSRGIATLTGATDTRETVGG